MLDISGLYLLVFLMPGFLCIFFPYKLIGVKVRLSDFELTLLSLVLSVIIFILTLIFYYFLKIFTIFNLVGIDLSTVTLSKLVGNWVFDLLFVIWSSVFFILVILNIGKDRFYKLRKKLFNKEFLLSPEECIWDAVFDSFRGHVIVECKSGDSYVGVVEKYTHDEDSKELLIKHPQTYDIEKDEVDDFRNEEIEEILFLNDDIKRIYFMPLKEKDK